MPVSHPEEQSLKSLDAPSLEVGMLLRIQAPDYPPREVHIRSPRCSIGSGRDCTLRLVAEGVEPLHCVIIRSDRQARVERAAGSTWLNHREFHSAPFQPGDRLQVGPIEIQLVGFGTESKKPTSSEAPGPPVPPRPQQSDGLQALPESFPAEAAGQTASPSKGSPKPKATERTIPEQTTRRLGHRRAKHLVGLLRQARQEIIGLQTEIVQLRRQLEGFRTQDASARALEESRKEELWNKRTQLLADLEARLAHRQRDLDRREAQWESQRLVMERQWAEWKEEQSRLRQELQRQAQTLQQQQAELLQSKKALEEQLRQLEAQQQTLLEQQQRHIQHRQALQTQQEAAAQKQQELAEWQHRLETQEQALADQQTALAQQQADLAQQHQVLQRQQELLERERQEWQEQKLQADPSPPEVGVPQERIDRYTRPPEPRSALHAEEVLRRLGMMPEWEEEEASSISTAQKEPGLPAETSPPHSRPRGVETSETDEEGLVHAYMERLLGRSWKQAAQPHPADPYSQPEITSSSERTYHQRKEDSEAGSNEGSPPPRKRRGTAEWVPRADAPERGVDLDAMRDLANLSASRALEHHQRRQALAAVWAKFLVSVFSLLLGCGMLWVWGGNPEHELALYAAGACFAVAALWGLQYFLLAGKLVLRSFGFRSAQGSDLGSSGPLKDVPVPSEADCPSPFVAAAPPGVGPAETAAFGMGEHQEPASCVSAEKTASGMGWQAEEGPRPPEAESPPPTG